MNNELQKHFEEFIAHKTYVSRLRPASIKTYQEVWKHFTQQMPEVTTVRDLSPEVITTFFTRLQKRQRIVGKELKRTGIRASTVDTYARRLKCFFDWLIVRDELDQNPVNLKDLPTPVYDDNRALDQQRIEKIIVAIVQNSKNTFVKHRDLAMVNVFMFCGVRRGELLGIRVTDVDFGKGVLRINGATSKSKTTRYVPLNRVVLQSLDEYMTARKQRCVQCEYLWVSDTRDAKFTEHGLNHWVKRIRTWSGVKFHVHKFRHSFAVALAKGKNNIVFIQKLLGHTDLRMTQKYLRSMGVEDMRDSVDKLSLASFG
jgi:site-specific recombinase XerD